MVVEKGHQFAHHALEHLILGDVALALAQPLLLVHLVLPKGQLAISLIQHQFGDLVGEEGIAGAELAPRGLFLDEDGQDGVQDVDGRLGGEGGGGIGAAPEEGAEEGEALRDVADVLEGVSSDGLVLPRADEVPFEQLQGSPVLTLHLPLVTLHPFEVLPSVLVYLLRTSLAPWGSHEYLIGFLQKSL